MQWFRTKSIKHTHTDPKKPKLSSIHGPILCWVCMLICWEEGEVDAFSSGLAILWVEFSVSWHWASHVGGQCKCVLQSSQLATANYVHEHSTCLCSIHQHNSIQLKGVYPTSPVLKWENASQAGLSQAFNYGNSLCELSNPLSELLAPSHKILAHAQHRLFLVSIVTPVMFPLQLPPLSSSSNSLQLSTTSPPLLLSPLLFSPSASEAASLLTQSPQSGGHLH